MKKGYKKLIVLLPKEWREAAKSEKALQRSGRYIKTPTENAAEAAQACTERDESGKRMIDGQTVMDMPLADFQVITRKARGFLLRAE